MLPIIAGITRFMDQSTKVAPNIPIEFVETMPITARATPSLIPNSASAILGIIVRVKKDIGINIIPSNGVIETPNARSKR